MGRILEYISCLIYWQFRERYTRIHTDGGPQNAVSRSRENAHKQLGRSRRVIDTDSEDEDEDLQSTDPSKPWLVEFDRYFSVVESIPDNMTIVEWWGVRPSFLVPWPLLTEHLDDQLNAHRYPVWASLARDYLAFMASSVSSERAFSSAGITISKRRNRLKGDIVEALQCLKCMYHEDLIFCAVVTSKEVQEEMENTEYFEESNTTDETCEVAENFTWDSILIDDDENDEVIVIS